MPHQLAAQAQQDACTAAAEVHLLAQPCWGWLHAMRVGEPYPLLLPNPPQSSHQLPANPSRVSG